MATHETLTSLFSAIADKIRKKTGSTATIVADDFPDAIDSILTPTDGTIATKTSSDLTASGATVTVPAGYYASQASKSVATATQATPSISIDSNGLITASTTQSAGYVSSGTKSATKQLTTQTAKTMIPSTSSQTAVSSGVYTTGTVTVKGDTNLIPENIKSGVNIFGVDGSLSSGGFYQSTITLSGETSFAITGIGNSFTPNGVYIMYSKQIYTESSDDASTYEARSIFYHKDIMINDANRYWYSYLRTSNSRCYMKTDPIDDCDYVEIIFNEDNTIYIELTGTGHIFDGDYYIYVF